MAETLFGALDPLTQKIWSQKAWKWAVDNNWFTKAGIMGTGDNVAIQVDTSLTANKGDTIVFQLRAPLTGEGAGDDGSVEGALEALDIRNFSVRVHERAHGVRSNGQMSEQRTATNIREEGSAALGQWQANVLVKDCYRAMAGLYNAAGIAVVNEKAPSTNRIWRGGQTVAGVVQASAPFATDALVSAQTATDVLFGTQVIEIVRRKATTEISGTPIIRPVLVNGKEFYIYLGHSLQYKAMRQETGEAGWKLITAKAGLRGDENNIFSGALGIWDQVVLYEWGNSIMLRTGAGGTTPAEGFTLPAGRATTSDAVASGKTVCRGLFMGAQAAVVGWAKKPTWTEQMYDVGRKAAMANTSIYGVSKTRFSKFDPGATPNDPDAVDTTNAAGDDFGVIAVDTCVVAD